jgi:hypothetical protein
LGGWWSNRQPEVLWERRCEFSSWAHMSVPFASIRSWFCPGRTCGGGRTTGVALPLQATTVSHGGRMPIAISHSGRGAWPTGRPPAPPDRWWRP